MPRHATTHIPNVTNHKGSSYSVQGCLLEINHFMIFILNLLRSNQSEILFDNIKSIKVKQRFSNKFLNIRLKNNRVRRVMGVDNSEELEEFIKLDLRNRLNCSF